LGNGSGRSKQRAGQRHKCGAEKRR
jgi:hypothetical protein